MHDKLQHQIMVNFGLDLLSFSFEPPNAKKEMKNLRREKFWIDIRSLLGLKFSIYKIMNLCMLNSLTSECASIDDKKTNISIKLQLKTPSR